MNKIAMMVAGAKLAIKDAESASWREMADIRRKTAEAIQPHQAVLDKIRDEYMLKAYELAVADHSVPYHTWGALMDQPEVFVHEDGIALMWDINGDYAPTQFKATWEQLT